jgi:Phage phiEco32-like COOH.NH2 ligase-type 2
VTYYLMHSGQPSARRLLARIPRLSSYVSLNQVSSNDFVIRYGAVHESDPLIGTLLNSREAVYCTNSRQAMAKMLRRMGIRFAQEPIRNLEWGAATRFTRQYRISFFDMAPIGIFRSDTGATSGNNRITRLHASFREVEMTEEKITPRIVYLASRALHALGLDYGMVSVGMGTGGILHVIDVSPTPILEGRILDVFVTAIERFIDREDRLAHTGIQSVLLGTDLEVMLRNPEGKMVLASNYFTRKGTVGCDDRSVNFDGKRLPLMELRPNPESTPAGLMQNLRATMEDAIKKIGRPKVEWRAGSMPFRPYCTGGHLHFSGVPLSSVMVKALDNYLGLPLMVVENRSTAELRRPRYGFLGDVRQKDYGGFEYRTPASFIVSQEITMATFCLAHLIALYHRELPIVDIYESNVQAAFYKGNVEALRPILSRNIEAIRRLPMFERYKEMVNPLFEMIAAGRVWDEDVDVRASFGLLSARPVRARTQSQRRRRSRLSI